MADPEELERAVERVQEWADEHEPWLHPHRPETLGSDLRTVLAALSTEGAQEREWCSACKDMGVFRNRVTGEKTSPCPACGRGPAPEQPQGEGERWPEFSRDEVASLAMAADEFRNEYGPGLEELCERLNAALRRAAGDRFVLREVPSPDTPEEHG